MQPTTIDLSWLCIVIPVVVVIVAAVLGTRSRFRYARRIREAQAGGAFADMNTAEAKSRFRLLAILALIGLAGVALSVVIMLGLSLGRIHIPVGVIIGATFLFGIIAAVAGFLMQREIDRRL